jgi:hypothetical protein
MRLIKIVPLILVMSILAGKAAGQIFSPEASDSFGAAYNLAGGTDKVFIYNIEKYQQGRTIAIFALSEDKLTGWNFNWSVYDQNTHAYIPIPGTSSGFSSIIDTLTVSSGYQVTMTKGSVTSVYRVWLVFNDFQVVITNKDAENKLKFGYYNCTSLDLRSDTTAYPSYYYNPVNGNRIKIVNNFTIRWTTDNPEAGIPPSKLITRVSNPPFEDTWYKVNVTDRFKLLRTDSVFYKSIQSKAEMAEPQYLELDSANYPGKNYQMYYRPSSEKTRSAPGKYRFDISGSKNSVSYELKFGDDSILVTDTAGTSIEHEYKKPGTYHVTLITKADKPDECVDSVNADVELNYGKFLMPNVFSPDHEYTLENYETSENDIFRSEDVSVVTIEITIFDRAGRKMHEYAGNIRDWKGWDGNVKNSSRKAPEGVYYWAVSTLIYFKNPDPNNDQPIKKEVYSGFFHLYRQ